VIVLWECATEYGAYSRVLGQQLPHGAQC
jgi:hypothetical protein